MTAIITCTQGDWQYIDEWIRYHRNLGVDLFLIAYNGNSADFDKLPKYDFVRYFDISYNNNYDIYNDLDCINHVPFHYPSTSIRIRTMSLQIKALNMLFMHLKHFYPKVKYSVCIDTDEFIVIKDNRNVTEFFDSKFTEDIESMHMHMQFYGDNGLIYNDGRPVLERFYCKENALQHYATDLWHCKSVVNLHFEPNITDSTVMLTSHCTNYGYHKFGETQFDINEIELAHFWTKSLEEFVAKFNKNVNSEYLERFRGKFLSTFFCSDNEYFTNEVTVEKLQAIDGLLEKYGIEYSIEDEDEESELKDVYLKYKNQKHDNMLAIVSYVNTDFEQIEKFISHYEQLGVTTFYFGIDSTTPLTLYSRENLDIHYIDVHIDQEVVVNDNDHDFGNDFDKLPYNVKVMNMLYETIRTMNPSIDFLLPVSIYDYVQMRDYDDLNKFIEDKFPKGNSSYALTIKYIDRSDIYDSEDEINLNELSLFEKDKSITNSRILIYLRHSDTNKGNCKLLSAHHCGMSSLNFSFNSDEIYIIRYNLNTLESYIALFAPESNHPYKEMYENNILGNYFVSNQVTYEKLQAVPVLFEKYGIDYHPELQETNPNIRAVYKEANKLY